MLHAISALTSALYPPAAATPRPAAPTESDPAVREAAAQFLTELFFGPLLAEARRAPFKADWIDGGQTESIFGEQLDQRIADRVALADRGLNDHVVRELSQHGKVRTAPPRTAPAGPGADRVAWPATLATQRLTEEPAA
ncbi:MAG: hypothetical protein IPM18_12275 [Phycisphaerales bacterium]|nr:hypothetical protein [Phycisphaerales bacterium]